MRAYHPSVPGFQGRQVGYDGGAEADVALTDAPNYPKQKEHAEAPGNCPDRVGGQQAHLRHTTAKWGEDDSALFFLLG